MTCSNKLVVYIILVTKSLSTYHCKYYNYKRSNIEYYYDISAILRYSFTFVILLLYYDFMINIKIIGAIAIRNRYNQRYKWPYHIIDLNCTGNEQSIWNCSYNGLLNYECPKYYDASIICQGNNDTMLLLQ